MDEIPQNHSKNKQLTTTDTVQMRGGGGLSRRKPHTTTISSSSDGDQQVKLAGLAISFNIRLRSADMPLPMQERALRHARALLDAAAHRRPNPTLLSRSLKKEFDSVYGLAWHCIAGKSFGSFVTHSPGGFLYFSIDSFSFLLFKTEVHLLPQLQQPIPIPIPIPIPSSKS